MLDLRPNKTPGFIPSEEDVWEVQVLSNNLVIVEYSWEYVAEFIPYGSPAQDLEEYNLFCQNKPVFRYACRSGPLFTPQDHSVSLLEEGYTQQIVASFWRSAYERMKIEWFHLDRNDRKHVEYPFHVLSLAHSDLIRLERGYAPFVTSLI